MTARRRTAQTRRMLRTRRQLTDEETRARLANDLRAAYLTGASIRELGAQHHLAFGTVRTLLLETGVVLRARGGPNHVRRHADEGNTPTKNKRSGA